MRKVPSVMKKHLQGLHKALQNKKIFKKIVDFLLKICYYIITGNERVPKTNRER